MITDNEVDILITRFFSGEATPEEAIKLEDWAKLSSDHRSYANSFSALFSYGDLCAPEEEKRAWENIEVSLGSKNNERNIINWKWVGIAASIVVIFSTSLLIERILKPKSSEIIYEAALSSRKILLKDNSEITVSPRSSITIDKDYGTKSRRITLKGSASFSVVHDPSSEFIVNLNHVYIRDIGTVFSVLSSASGDSIVISVTQGEVSVFDDLGSSANLRAGEKVLYIRSLKKLQMLNAKQAPDSALQKKPTLNTKPARVKTDIKLHELVIENVGHSLKRSNDSSGVSDYNKYPRKYPLNHGYTPQGIQDRRTKDSIEVARILADLLKDQLITRGTPLTFILSDTAFILNGARQTDAVFQRYRNKYVPATTRGKGWIWSHSSEGL